MRVVPDQSYLVHLGKCWPGRPETGYGYIRRGAALNVAGGCFRVEHFAEKPEPETARAYVDSGVYLWNSGIFLLPAKSVLAELEQHEPAVLAAVRAAVDAAARDMDFLRLDPEAFAASPSISIDYAVMERTDRAAVVPSTFVWSDVGAWSALWELADRDSSDNVEIGDTLADPADPIALPRLTVDERSDAGPGVVIRARRRGLRKHALAQRAGEPVEGGLVRGGVGHDDRATPRTNG